MRWASDCSGCLRASRSIAISGTTPEPPPIRSAGVDTSDLHPALIPAAKYQPQFSSFIEREHARLDGDATSKLSGIDMKRYEDLDAPESTDPTSDEDKPELLQKWNRALKQAYTSSEYVEGRLTQLGGRTAAVEQGSAGDNSCTVRVEHHEYRDEWGDPTVELVQVDAGDVPGGETAACRMATALAEDAASRLPG